MAMNFVPLEKSKHKNLKVAFDSSLPHAKNSHLSAASIKEYAQLSATMPIIFIKDPQGHFRSVAVLSIENEQNMFLQEDKWKGPHVPMNILRYPFDIRQDGDKLVVYIDEGSDMVQENEGMPLFNEDEPSDFLADRQRFLSNLAASEIQTNAFIDHITKLDLLEEMEVFVGYKDGTRRSVTGMHSINEKKLLDLDDDKVVELHKKGYLGACYSIMLSMAQLARIVELSANTDKPIQAVQIKRESDPEQAPAQN